MEELSARERNNARRRVPPDKRQRTLFSCDWCKVHRCKCDRRGVNETCKVCDNNGRKCTTTITRRKRGHFSVSTGEITGNDQIVLTPSSYPTNQMTGSHEQTPTSNPNVSSSKIAARPCLKYETVTNDDEQKLTANSESKSDEQNLTTNSEKRDKQKLTTNYESNARLDTLEREMVNLQHRVDMLKLENEELRKEMRHLRVERDFYRNDRNHCREQLDIYFNACGSSPEINSTIDSDAHRLQRFGFQQPLSTAIQQACLTDSEGIHGFTGKHSGNTTGFYPVFDPGASYQTAPGLVDWTVFYAAGTDGAQSIHCIQ